MYQSHTVFSPPDTKNRCSRLAAPASVPGVDTSTFQVFEPLAGLVERDFLHSLKNLAVQHVALQLVFRGQIHAFDGRGPFSWRLAQKRLKCLGHDFVVLGLHDIGTFFAGARNLVQSLRRRGVNNLGTNARLICVGHLATYHAFISRCASCLSVGRGADGYQSHDQVVFHVVAF